MTVLPHRLGPEEVHLVCHSLDIPADERRQLEGILSREERRSARRYHFEKDRRRAVVSRGLLRRLLGEYTGVPPERVQIGCNPYGKPELSITHRPQRLAFNLTHSGDKILYGFAMRRRIGVDIEQVRTFPGAQSLAEHFFCRRETRAISALPRDHRLKAFFDCWTLKEAYVKAVGKGLSQALDSFCIDFLPAGGDAPSLVVNGAAAHDNWHLRQVETESGYVAAVAVEGDRPLSFQCNNCRLVS